MKIGKVSGSASGGVVCIRGAACNSFCRFRCRDGSGVYRAVR
jgi:hypothetical protein